MDYQAMNHVHLQKKNFLRSHQSLLSKFTAKDSRKFLIALLLGQLHQLFSEIFQEKIQFNLNNSSIESYAMDSKIIQLLISGIIESGEYTLEGIAYQTHIPFDIILDAACGNGNQISITPWARIVELYVQVNPEISEVFFERLLQMGNKNRSEISLLLNEI